MELVVRLAAGLGIADRRGDAASSARTRSRSEVVARWQARRIAWHSMAIRASITSSMMSDRCASAKVKNSPSTEASGPPDDRADAVADLDDADDGKRPQRLAQAGPADAKLSRELALRDEAVARPDRAVEKLIAQEGEDFVATPTREQLAAQYLERAGFRILDRNWRCAEGEIDIVAAERRVLIVCEVKTRSDREQVRHPSRRHHQGQTVQITAAGHPLAGGARRALRRGAHRRDRAGP